jgi:carboxypeptidase C (cathepsin A)
MSWSYSLLLLAATASRTVAQFVPKPTDLISKVGYAGIPVRYKQVPTGICELDPNVKSFSGYADVEENQHMFFWFYEAREVDPKTAPLTLWISGGPGASSINEMFQHLGPCSVDSSGNVYNNPYSWTKYSNMLFVDQPTQVGFSYSIPVPGILNPDSDEIKVLKNNTCPPHATCGTWSSPDPKLTSNSTTNAAPNLWKTLQGFMGAFPQYARSSFHFTSESYGGHYAPVFSRYLEQQNAAKIPGATKIKLESVMVGNGWSVLYTPLTCPTILTSENRYEPIVQSIAYYNFTVSPGNTYDYKPFSTSVQKKMYDRLYGPGNCVDRLKRCAATGDDDVCSIADKYCGDKVEGLLTEIDSRDETDIRELDPDPYPYGFYRDYLNTPKVHKAIGAYTNWSRDSAAVGDAFELTGDDARESNTIEDMRALLDQGVTVAMYYGDADYSCNWLGGQAVAALVGAPGWKDAGYVNVTTSDGVVHGQVKQAGKFSFTRVYYAGHEVPFYQPVLAQEMMQRVISGVDVATGKVTPGASYRTKGTAESTYREGNATMQWAVTPINIKYDINTNAPGAPWK